MNVRYRVRLSDTERTELLSITEKGRGAARRFKRANILLLADEGRSDQDIASWVRAGTSTVFRVKRSFVEHGMDAALNELTRAGRPRKLDPKQEALVVATACSEAPEGRSRWTLKLLSDALVTSTDIDSISSQTIMRLLKEKEIKPWQKSELRAWEKARNAEGATIRWLFDIDKARVKLARAYPNQDVDGVTVDAEAA